MSETQLNLLPNNLFNRRFIPNEGGGGAVALASIISLVVSFITIVAGLWMATQFIIAGLEWMSAGGDSGKVANATKKMFNALLGLIVVVAAIIIIKIISLITGIDMLNLTKVVTVLKGS